MMQRPHLRSLCVCNITEALPFFTEVSHVSEIRLSE